MHGITKNGIGYDQYEFQGAFPGTEDCDWEDNEQIREVLEDSGVGNDEETWQGRLTEDWGHHPAGSLVIGGLSEEGHPFVILSQF